MADLKKRISELPESQSTEGLYTIGVNSQNESVKVPLGDILEEYDEAVQDAADAKTIAQNASQTAAAASSKADLAKSTADEAASDAADAKSDAADAKAAAQNVQDTSRLVSGSGTNSAVLKNGGNTTTGTRAVAIGSNNTVSGTDGFAAGADNVVSGNDAMALGDEDTASGNSSVAEGHHTTASAAYAHSEGNTTQARGESSHAEGQGTIASGIKSHAEGNGASALGAASHAEGSLTEASGGDAHAEGETTTASGDASHAEGNNTTASGDYSHSEGEGTSATGIASHAQGKYNLSSNDSVDEVGIGTSFVDRKNAEETKNDGRKFIIGIGGYDGTNASGGTAKTLQQVITEIGANIDVVSEKANVALFINVNRMFRTSNAMTLDGALSLLYDNDSNAYYKYQGVVISFLGTEGKMLSYQWHGNQVSDFTDTSTWTKFGGSASVGNCYNVTNDVPLQSGYYTLERAINVAYTKGYTSIGVQITFAIARNSWKTYQFIGEESAEATFKNINNWLDLAGMSAGAETLINVDALCGACTSASFYTLEYAIAAIISLSTTTGIEYRKSGLVITYMTAENTWECKQFKGVVSDFGETSLWQDFGGGGSQVETSDEPEEDGEDAFSTGGAYTHIPTGIKLDTETEGIVKMQLENAEGDGIGDEIQFQVGTGGGGGGGGTIVTMAFETSPFYGNAGSSFVLRAAVRSVTTIGQSEQDNMIATIALVDRDTNTTLEVFTFNKASSASMSTYDFVMDVSKYFANAGVRRFKCVITDDAGNTGSRNINVTAVDVTVSSVQTLQYTSSTALSVGGTAKSIPLFKFANNASDRGINAIVEIYLNGEWQELGNTIVQDTYSHGISIDPNNCLGSALSHGVYRIRVHGVDVASGVVGNYLYSGIFVIDSTSNTPLVVESWMSDAASAVVKLYETITVNYAVYDPNNNAPTATVYLNGTAVQSHTAYRSSAYTYSHQVSGVASDGSFSHIVKVKCGNTYGVEASFLVSGTVIDAVMKDGAIYGFEFSNRSNEEADHTISNNGYSIAVNGSNWSSTGFISFLGEKALRIAEDVTAMLNHKPFKPTSIESNGMAIQFAFAAKNLVDDDAVLMQCFNEGVGAGFYVTGKCVGIYCSTGLSNHAEERAYRQGEKVTVAVVVEPAIEGLGQTRNGTTYYFIKLYLNGEEVAVIGYVAGQSNLIQEHPITFDGSQGDFYLYYITAWEDYFQFDQAFQNYLVKLSDTDDMVEEYNFESVMASQQVTELGITTTKLRPQASQLADRSMAYIIECPYNGSNIEGLDETVSTKDQIYVTLYYIDPARPWTNFKATDVARRNQGTTSAQRPVKNPRYYLAQKKGSTYDKSSKTGGTVITLLNPDNTTEAGRRAIALAAINKVQIHDNSVPVDIITVKVDYSDSSNANDCGICDMMNATFRALGRDYMTPAQRAFDGTWTKGSLVVEGLVMNHSTANIPVAMYRSKSDTGSSPYFHSKGNWKEDKKEQVALGFNDVPGYNKGCLNYGDFIEFYGKSAAMLNAEAVAYNTEHHLSVGDEGYKATDRATDETLSEIKDRFLATSGLDTASTYVLTQYCGSSYKVMKHNGSQWVEQSGSMVQNANGKWTVTGSVVNPTDGFELLNYQGMDWFKGVSSVADMMAASTSFSKWVQALIDDGSISVQTVPAWTYYFECLVDDDNLAIAYALGKKVPYNLFRWMQFCDYCDYDENGATALTRWRDGLYRFASPYSCLSYDVFTDYLAAVDQRAKNMQPMWFLEDGCKVVNGVYYNAENEASDSTSGMLAMRMYLNKVYDCDTCNGKDNDGGQTVDAEVDPNKMPDAQTGYTNPYAGYNSVLFRNIYLQQTVYVDAQNTELSLRTVASAMRSCTATVGGLTLKPFSPEGAYYFFVTARIKRWQKKVSSYDGERKYIDFTSTTANNIYFYALQGLGLTSLPAFIERRWRIRDGFYGTGDFFSGVLSGRVNAPNGAKIRITAAKTGYFGIGNDSSGSISESVYLEAGESHNFTNFSHEEGALLYIYQADRMSMIDLSEITLSNNFDFSVMTLAEEIYLGKVGKVNLTIGAYERLTNVNLGELPFLTMLDIRETIITNVVCSGCPRLESLYAAGSQLTRADIADGAKITYMQLPSTYTYLKLRYLPNLQRSGLVLADKRSITTLIVENCSKISSVDLLREIAGTSGNNLRVVRATPYNVSYDGSDLTTISALHLSGLDANLTAQAAPALVGTYMLTRYTDEAVLAAWQSEFSDLTIHQSQYTLIEMDDTESDPQNIVNLDNNTSGDSYEPSGHVSKIRSLLIPVTGKLNATSGKWEGRKMSESDYKKLKDGSDFDYSDNLGSGNDAMMRIPHLWYKGINDFKNQKKYIAWSSLPTEPISSASRINRKTLSQIILQENAAIMVSNITENVSTLESSGVLAETANHNTYRLNVEGMKQVRYPGLNNEAIGACFLNASGVIISKYNMAVANNLFDFVNGDYIFINVPSGAKYFVFTSPSGIPSTLEAIAVDSTEIEAIEPDWVESEECLGAIYQGSIDSLTRLRSVSGATVKVGTGTSTTSIEWQYDANGNPANTPTGTMNYTAKDFQNLARRRGAGYQLIDYEMSKLLAILFYSLSGTRDAQKYCGYGKSSGGSTGYLDSIGNTTSTNLGSVSGSGNKCMGFESFFACTYEWMDMVAVNVPSFVQAFKDKMSPDLGTYPLDAVYHIYDPINETERTVQALTTNSGYCVARTKHGRFCDIIASKFSSDNSRFAANYADGQWYTHSRCRVVGRSNHIAHANGGVAYAGAIYASSLSNPYSGSRLAFRGQITIAE